MATERSVVIFSQGTYGLPCTLYINKGRKADFSSLSPIIIIEESNLQTFLHSLGRHMLC